MKVAVCGVTGLVGSVMCKVLEERNFPVDEFIPVASDRSIGKEVVFKGKSYKVVGMSDAVAMRPDLALFSAGGRHRWNGRQSLQLLALLLLTTLRPGEWIKTSSSLSRK